jgi:hypothetical protein
VDAYVGYNFFATHVVDPFNRVAKIRSNETALH